MTGTPLVSIALCIYNGDAFLEQQLQTLLNQTYTNLEIVIIDDRSTDSSIEIIKKYSGDKRLKLFVNQTNLGHVKNFEKAINVCSGDYVALADQDDIWNLNKIEIMVDQIGDSVLIYHDSEFIDNSGKAMGKMSDLFNMYAGTRPLSFLFYNCVSGHACMIKKELVSKLGSFNPDLCHDWWIAFVAGNVGKITYIDKTLVKYRQHAQSTTDILELKEGKSARLPKFGEVNPVWLKNCETVAGQYQNVINRIGYLQEHKNLLNSVKLFALLFAHKRDLFFIRKKNAISKLNYIRKMGFFDHSSKYALSAQVA